MLRFSCLVTLLLSSILCFSNNNSRLDSLLKNSQTFQGEAKWLNDEILGFEYLHTSQEKALSVFYTTLEDIRRVGDKYYEAKYLRNIASVLQTKSDFNTALDYYRSSNVLFVDVGEPNYLILNYIRIANLLKEKEKFLEASSYLFKCVSILNGFKIKTTGGIMNTSGGTYIYCAFGQSLVGSNGVVATAR